MPNGTSYVASSPCHLLCLSRLFPNTADIRGRLSSTLLKRETRQSSVLEYQVTSQADRDAQKRIKDAEPGKSFRTTDKTGRLGNEYRQKNEPRILSFDPPSAGGKKNILLFIFFKLFIYLFHAFVEGRRVHVTLFACGSQRTTCTQVPVSNSGCLAQRQVPLPTEESRTSLSNYFESHCSSGSFIILQYINITFDVYKQLMPHYLRQSALLCPPRMTLANLFVVACATFSC